MTKRLASIVLGLAALSTVFLPTLASAQQYQLQATVVTALPLNNAWIGVGNLHLGGLQALVPLGNLPASTAQNPDVVYFSIPNLGEYQNNPDFYLGGTYATGSVILSQGNTDPYPDTPFDQWYPYTQLVGEESDIANDFVTGNTGQITWLFTYDLWIHDYGYIGGIPYGGIVTQPSPANLFSWSAGTFDGTASVIVVPEPTIFAIVAACGFLISRRRRIA